MTGRKKKTQISVYLEPDVMTMLSDYVARREQPMSLVVEAAVASFLSPDDAERREALRPPRILRKTHDQQHVKDHQCRPTDPVAQAAQQLDR